MKNKDINKKLYRSFVVILILAFVFVSAGSFAENSAGEFNNGTYYNTEFNSTAVMLKYWNESERELPNNQIADEWGINMTGNVLLMHLNEAGG